MRWRLKQLQNSLTKLLWRVRLLTDFSSKDKVEGISVIVVGRNDNYGGEFSKRLQVTLDWNLGHLPNSELIYVEWNQIPDRISDCIWITNRFNSARCYVVPNEVHQQFCTNSKMPVMEYFAKNIGIRKARFDWILLINADCFIGNDVIRNINKLDPDAVYGTHYTSIRWDGKPINGEHLTNKNLITVTFPVEKSLAAVVGNFILTHRKNWLRATGYDERLTSVRVGVDENGLLQLLHSGLKTKVIGHHFHLDHPESIILGGANETHGYSELLKNNIPYKNADNWGLIDYPLKKIDDRIWVLQKI